MKFDSAGMRLWSTYYGGSGQDYGYGVATDGGGNVYITGVTSSAGFPVTGGACQPTSGGQQDNYLASFDSSGNRLCATYIGGSMEDGETSGGNIAVSGCYVYITGYASDSFPVTSGSFQTNYGGGGAFDAFVAQLSKDCSCSCTISSLVEAPVNESSVSVYPNPASEKFYIELEQVTHGTNIMLMNVIGKQVLSTKIESGKAVIDVWGLSSGIYLLSIQTGERTLNKRVIIN